MYVCLYLQSAKTHEVRNSDETDSVKTRSSIQGENSVHRSRNARDALNKFEGKENAKDTSNKPATVSNQCTISLLKSVCHQSRLVMRIYTICSKLYLIPNVFPDLSQAECFWQVCKQYKWRELRSLFFCCFLTMYWVSTVVCHMNYLYVHSCVTGRSSPWGYN